MSRKVADTELLIIRAFDAPASLIFELWSRPEHLQRWLGPGPVHSPHSLTPEVFVCPAAEVDFRVGGRYRALIKSAEHGESWFGGVYREIVPHERLEFTFAWHGEWPAAGGDTLVRVRLKEASGKTTQTFHQALFASVERRDSHVSGWTSSFNKLAVYSAQLVKEQLS